MTLAELAQFQLDAQLGQATLILAWLAVTALLLLGWAVYEALSVAKRPRRNHPHDQRMVGENDMAFDPEPVELASLDHYDPPRCCMAMPTARAILDHMPVINDPAISEAMAALEDDEPAVSDAARG